jgi:replicative DNA helicase
LKSADLLNRGDYDQIKSVIDKAMTAGQERNIGHIYLDEFELRTSKISRNTVMTPWDCINGITDGGLGAGELGCVVAPSGIGKSWVLTSLGKAALQQGKTVAHYTFELSENYTGLRYDTSFTGIDASKIKDHKKLVEDMMSRINGKLFIKYFPTRSITINAIIAHIQRLVQLGHAPDLVLIDYADLMRSAGKADARHEELGFIHEEIRGMLGEHKIPGWTASQSQRSSLQDDVVEADKIAGSYAKIMTDDFVMSVSRKMSDKMTNTGRVHVIKNRFGPDGMVFPAELNLAEGKIEVWDENTPQGILLKNKMASGDGVLKSMLAKKLMHPATNPQP